MTTYAPSRERANYARQTMAALVRFIRSEEPIRLHIADDGTPLEHRDFIQHLMNWSYTVWGTAPTWSDAARGGIGASLNCAMEYVPRDDLWMYITDDWVLTKHLYLGRPAKLIREENYDLVRLGPIHPNLSCTTKFSVPHGWYLELHQSCGGFVFGTRPFLATREFVRKVGPFAEGLNAYETERLYAEAVARCKDVKLASINMRGPWSHIGDFEVGTLNPREGIAVA